MKALVKCLHCNKIFEAYKCWAIVIYGLLHIHWHVGGDEMPKIRLRNVSIKFPFWKWFQLPFKYYPF